VAINMPLIGQAALAAIKDGVVSGKRQTR